MPPPSDCQHQVFRGPLALRLSSLSVWGTPALGLSSSSVWGTPTLRLSTLCWGTPALRLLTPSVWGTPALDLSSLSVQGTATLRLSTPSVWGTPALRLSTPSIQGCPCPQTVNTEYLGHLCPQTIILECLGNPHPHGVPPFSDRQSQVYWGIPALRLPSSCSSNSHPQTVNPVLGCSYPQTVNTECWGGCCLQKSVCSPLLSALRGPVGPAANSSGGLPLWPPRLPGTGLCCVWPCRGQPGGGENPACASEDHMT